MSGDRVSALEAMLERRPDDSRLRFGLAIEYLNSGRSEEGIRHLEAYLRSTDDEGNAWGRLGQALRDLGREAEARDAYGNGIEAATRHGHPTLAAELHAILDGWDE